LLVSWKGKTFVGTSDELISLNDLAVSLTDLAGVSWGAETDGDNLSEIFTNSIAKGPSERIIYDFVPCHQATDRGGKEWVGLKTRDMTYAKEVNDKNGVLFKDIDDPFQMHNLWNNRKYQQEKDLLCFRLDNILAQHNYKFRSWQQTVVEDGYLEKWNESQLCFDREPLNV
jgi:hypothetical protein